MKNNVINLTVVLSDGTIIKTAQRARKLKLFLGKFCLNFIIELARRKLFSIPICGPQK